jgi:alkylation response protein AidB-like acyl-CoA dehydrogenase
MSSRTPEQAELHAGMARWGERLSAGHLERDASSAFSQENWELLADTGLLRLPFPKEWGGADLSLTTTMHVLEALGQTCRDSGLNFSATTTIASTGVPLVQFGTSDQKNRYLPRLCSGEIIGAHAITEPTSGSDALSMRTRARREGDEFVLNGSKCFVTNGPIADVFVVYARTHPQGGPLGITAFLVDRNTPGLDFGSPLHKMGLRSSPMCELFFDECRVPAEAVLGRVGGGFLVLDHVMKREILMSFTVSLGEMVHRTNRCISYAKERRAFGNPISSYQAVSQKIVDMTIRVETARKWLFDTADKLTAGEDVTVDLAIAKILTSEGNVSTSLSAVRIFGGHGYMTEQGLEKELRDSVGGTIYSGTNETQYNRIAAALGLTQ